MKSESVIGPNVHKESCLYMELYMGSSLMSRSRAVKERLLGDALPVYCYGVGIKLAGKCDETGTRRPEGCGSLD
jgi:hypothetical protein